MEVLGRLFAAAREQGVLRSLAQEGIRYQCSLYADDVILFAYPEACEARAIKAILQIFEEASGLKTNMAKCSITNIFGAEEAIPELQRILGCQVAPFPIRYLGLPLSTTKLPKDQVRRTVDAVARRLPACHGPLMAKSGRLIWVKSVLSAIPVYCMIADGLPPWAQAEIDAICRRFLWSGKDGDTRGKCMVAWRTCTRPKGAGRVGHLRPQAGQYSLRSQVAVATEDRRGQSLGSATPEAIQGSTGLLQSLDVHRRRQRS
jgi:hypothetical protein